MRGDPASCPPALWRSSGSRRRATSFCGPSRRQPPPLAGTGRRSAAAVRRALPRPEPPPPPESRAARAQAPSRALSRAPAVAAAAIAAAGRQAGAALSSSWGWAGRTVAHTARDGWGDGGWRQWATVRGGAVAPSGRRLFDGDGSAQPYLQQPAGAAQQQAERLRVVLLRRIPKGLRSVHLLRLIVHSALKPRLDRPKYTFSTPAPTCRNPTCRNPISHFSVFLLLSTETFFSL
eukprot:SAG11_NODE_3881_length_2170_cov_5.197489_1_plen_234_part_00